MSADVVIACVSVGRRFGGAEGVGLGWDVCGVGCMAVRGGSVQESRLNGLVNGLGRGAKLHE